MENMNKEEKEAIEYIKAFQKDLYGASEKNLMAIYIDRVWNYINKLQKENEDMREELQMFVDTDIMKLQEENKDLKKEIDNLIKENHKHIDYIASMKKKQEDKIRNKIEELAEGRNYIIVNAEVISIQTLLDFLELLGDDKDE